MDKTFDCLKMKEKLQAKVYEKIKDMTSPELCAYLEKSMENNAFWQSLVNRDNSHTEQEARAQDAAQSVIDFIPKIGSLAVRDWI